MNHGPAFQALWTKLRHDVRDLQNRGYYGDGALSATAASLIGSSGGTGYWSSGKRLADSARIGSEGLDAAELPEYMVRMPSQLPYFFPLALHTLTLLRLDSVVAPSPGRSRHPLDAGGNDGKQAHLTTQAPRQQRDVKPVLV